jgi:beta-glucosidase
LLLLQYRAFIAKNIAPRFAFGYGLTYSNFTYTALQVRKNNAANIAALPSDASASEIPPQGGWSSLYDTVCTVSVTITNSGRVPAAEVAQLYVGIPDSGQPKVLRGFEKQLIQAGGSASVSFPLRRRDLSIWDVKSQQWRLPSGAFALYVGKSVLDIQLQGSLQL